MDSNKIETDKALQVKLDFRYEAPIDLVFDSLINPEHIKEWYSPEHLNITHIESNVEVGGEYSIDLTMKHGEGEQMKFKGKYLEIKRPELLVYTQVFQMGPKGNPTPETTITIRLKEDGNQTVLHFNQTGFDNKRAQQGARTSWPSSYKKLGTYLVSLSNE